MQIYAVNKAEIFRKMKILLKKKIPQMWNKDTEIPKETQIPLHKLSKRTD